MRLRRRPERVVPTALRGEAVVVPVDHDPWEVVGRGRRVTRARRRSGRRRRVRRRTGLGRAPLRHDPGPGVPTTAGRRGAASPIRRPSSIPPRRSSSTSRREPSADPLHGRTFPLVPRRLTVDGGVAEWFRQGSAKPCTRVRFPSPPLGVRSGEHADRTPFSSTGAVSVRSRGRPLESAVPRPSRAHLASTGWRAAQRGGRHGVGRQAPPRRSGRMLCMLGPWRAVEI